jgi:hypothetical protein
VMLMVASISTGSATGTVGLAGDLAGSGALGHRGKEEKSAPQQPFSSTVCAFCPHLYDEDRDRVDFDQ